MIFGHMVIAIGTVMARPETLDQALSIGQQHVLRSRAEPGCISHHLSQDAENPLRLTFVEEWADQAALDQHFKVPASGETVRQLTELSSEPPSLKIYDAKLIGER